MRLGLGAIGIDAVAVGGTEPAERLEKHTLRKPSRRPGSTDTPPPALHFERPLHQKRGPLNLLEALRGKREPPRPRPHLVGLRVVQPPRPVDDRVRLPMVELHRAPQRRAHVALAVAEDALEDGAVALEVELGLEAGVGVDLGAGFVVGVVCVCVRVDVWMCVWVGGSKRVFRIIAFGSHHA